MTVQPTSTQQSGFPGGPRLLADVGGTNARFALEVAPGSIAHIKVLACADYPSLADALRAYLALPEVAAVAGAGIRHGAIAIANPVTGDFVRMTNHHWEFSIEALRTGCGFDVLVVVNDFTALASSLPFLSDEQKGRFVQYLARIPTFVITAEYPAFVGVSAILNERLASA